MEGFLEISSSNYLFSSRKNFAKFALRKCRENCLNCFENCDIFLFEQGLQQHTLKDLNPSAGASFLFSSFDNYLANVFLKRGGFNTPYKMEINPSIETALLFSFSDLSFELEFFELIFFEKVALATHPKKEILPLEQSSLSLLTCNNFSSYFLESSSNTPLGENPSGTAFPFSFSQICKEAKR